MEPVLRVDLWYDTDCPSTGPVRHLLEECLRDFGLSWVISEHRDAQMLSPTVVVNGSSVVHVRPVRVRGCRTQIPTRDQFMALLDRAAETP